MDSTIYTHSLSQDDPHGTVVKALRLLKPHLPAALPLYRRLQYGRFFDATTLLTSLPGLKQEDSPPLSSEAEWIMAFVDRSCRPETEVWIFASWESRSEASNLEDRFLSRQQDALITALIKTIRSFPIPTSIHEDLLSKLQDDATNAKDVSGVARSDYSAHLLNPDIILCGAIHATTTHVLDRKGLVKHVFNGGLVPNHTYIFDVDELPQPKELPGNLRWGELKYEHFAIVRARTQIPRQDRTLAQLPNVAIFENETPVAWVFVGLDGSLTTLHVEEQYRGQGLAKAISIKLWKEKMGMFWEDGLRRLAHDYVVDGNKASCAVSESMGGKHVGLMYWVRVDLGALDK